MDECTICITFNCEAESYTEYTHPQGMSGSINLFYTEYELVFTLLNYTSSTLQENLFLSFVVDISLAGNK